MNTGKVAFAAVISWTGTVFGWFAQNVHWLAPMGGLALSALATFYAVKVARATLRQKHIETVEAERKLCDLCLTGHVPTHCPIEKKDRPKTCPLNYPP